MANPWDQDELIAPAPVATQQPAAAAAPWEQDEILAPAGYWDNGSALQGDGELGGDGTLEIDIIGGTPASETQMRAPLAAQVGDDARSLFALDSDIREGTPLHAGHALVAAAKDMFGTQRSVAEYVAEKSGGRVARTSDGGYGVILPDGREYRVNEAGLDSTDVANVVGNAAAFFLPATWAGRVAQARNLGLVARMGLQGATAAGTDAALQAGATGGDVDPSRTAAAAAGGIAGEAAGTAIGYGVNRLAAASRTASGANARQAQNLLAGAGAPSAPRQVVNRLAGGMEEVLAGADPNAILGRELYGFQYTLGQRLADPVRRFDQLSREEVLRQAPGAGGVFQRAADANRQRLGEVVDDLGTRLGGQPGATPAELAQGAASRLQGQARALEQRIQAAYQEAGRGGRAAVGVGAIESLPGRLRAAVADFGVNPELHPAASRTLAQLAEAASQAQQGNIKGVTLKAIETQRRIINNNVGAAKNPADRAATLAIKREFDGWLDEAVESSLVSGDPVALQALKDARQLRFEYGRRFEGKEEADRFISGLLDGSRTPEELVNIALGASQVSKAGGARFIERLRQASGNDPEVIGALRAAHFQRMAIGANGEPLAMGQIVRNIKATEYGNASIVRALYSPQEWAEVRRLAAVLDPLVAKGDMARTSGTAERMARMMFQRIGGGLPFVGEMVRAVGDVQSTMAAQRALSQPLRLPAQAPAAAVPTGAALGQEVQR